MRRTATIIPLLITFLFLLSCNGIKSLKIGAKETPYEAYVSSLEKANLEASVMASAWMQAGEDVFDDSVIVNLPFTETGFFSASQPDAHAYKFNVRDGQVLTVTGAVKARKDASVFLDLFIYQDNKWEAAAHGDSTLTLTYEFDRSQLCLVRLQPELLADVYYTISISLTPVLINPVSGASNRSIGSFYGDSRDGGRRKHEGVDIFAPKGTPVIAPTNGVVSRVGTNNLGGKVVWMRDVKRGHSYYFAHLDSQMVQPGVRVKTGDTLGTVGNTGNARTTPPHLHFGIYQSKSIDPIHYIRTMENLVDRLTVDTTFQPLVFKVSSKQLNLRTGPGDKQMVVGKLSREDYVRVIAQSGDWYRIQLPDKKQGYVFKKYLSPAEKGEVRALVNTTPLLSDIDLHAVPIAFLEKDSRVEVLARYQNYQYVKTQEGQVGWLLHQTANL